MSKVCGVESPSAPAISASQVIPFLVWEAGDRRSPSQGEFMFCFQVDGRGQRAHSVSAFFHLPSA